MFVNVCIWRLYSHDSSSCSPIQRDACIRHALQAEGMTVQDPKVPVTENFLCTGGLQPYRDHIACTGMITLIDIQVSSVFDESEVIS